MFRTEKQIEESLQEEIRILTMPDGKERAVRLYAGRWGELPCALYMVNGSMETLIQQALDHQDDNPNRGFEDCFSDILHYWNLERKKIREGHYD